jgi:hypothetical protein
MRFALSGIQEVGAGALGALSYAAQKQQQAWLTTTTAFDPATFSASGNSKSWASFHLCLDHHDVRFCTRISRIRHK